MTDYSTPNLTSPARNAVDVTPSDSTVFSEETRALYVGGAGDVSVVTAEGQTTTFVAVPGGSILPVRCSKVLSTSTTATSIVRLW